MTNILRRHTFEPVKICVLRVQFNTQCGGGEVVGARTFLAGIVMSNVWRLQLVDWQGKQNNPPVKSGTDRYLTRIFGSNCRLWMKRIRFES